MCQKAIYMYVCLYIYTVEGRSCAIQITTDVFNYQVANRYFIKHIEKGDIFQQIPAPSGI